MIKILNRLYMLYVWKFYGGVAYARKLGVSVGEGCRIYTKDFGGKEPYLVDVGNNVTITRGVRILTHDGALSLVKGPNNSRAYKYRKVKIGDNVFVGVDSIILPGVSVGDNTVVAAGSVVTKSFPGGEVIGGNPAKRIARYDSFIENNTKFLREGKMERSEIIEQANKLGFKKKC